LLARSRAVVQADKIDNDTIVAVRDLILATQKVNQKVFQPLADAQAQAADVFSGWKAMISAVAAAAAASAADVPHA